MLRAASSPRYPNSISEYVLLRQLGKGAFGLVYEASFPGDPSSRFAMKIIDKKIMKTGGMMQRIRNEVKIHHQLRHPSILELYHFFEDASHVYLVMELCPNGELYAHLKGNKRPLSEMEARAFFTDIVKGVDYLHAHGIIHRDLKLSNILLDADMKPKLADFGLAVRQNNPLSNEQKTICGTPNYLAPEIISKKPYGAAADQWSLGCILYTFLVGSPPFESAEIKDTFEKVSRAQYELPVWLSTDAQDLVAKLIVHNPDARLSTRQILAHPFLQGPIAKAPSSLFLTASAASQPLSTQHLKAIRQQTRHGLIELLANGHVWIDFRVDAVITCISADGGRITLYPKGCRPEDTGRLRPLQSYTYPHLPVATLKIYEYARRFVALLRSKTPRVIISTERFKAFLMDNGPPSDFLIRYNDHEIRAEYSIGNEVLRIFRSDKQIAEVVRPSASALDEARLDARCRLVLSDFLGRYRQASETASRISPDQDLQLAPFPFIVREHPSSNAETGQTGLCHPTLQTLPLTTLSEGLPKHSRQAQPDISNASCNFAFVYKTYLPDVGWCLASTSDEFLLLFSDGVTVLVDGRTNMVGFHDLKAGSTRWFKIDQALPHFAKKKLAYFPRFVQLLKQGYGHSFVT